MKLDEALEILKENGYIMEEWLPGTGTGGMDLFRSGKPSKTYVILHYLYEDAPDGVIWGKELCDKFFNGNNDDMRTWLSKNPDYILSDLINHRRFYKISKKGIKAIQEAISSFESNDW